MSKLVKHFRFLSVQTKRSLLNQEPIHYRREFSSTSFLKNENKVINSETSLVTCDFSHDEKIAVVTFNAPEKLNALSVDMGHAFKSTIVDLSKRNDLRSVVITGKGKRYEVS